VLHFKQAFHGRSGYTMSLTNTHDPRKYQYFPKFPWPRVAPPACRFPLSEGSQNLKDVMAAEQICCQQIREIVEQRRDTLAAIIIETIQAEGGDRHFRPEFLQTLKDICLDHELLLIFDEVQCGMGLTGHWWAFEALGVVPDIFAFGKKSQVCGIAAGPRLDEVDSVFKISSRINSTWGGNLVDMVRSEKCIAVIRDENLLENARIIGAYLLQELTKLAEESQAIDNIRGQGLMIAFDLPSEDERDQFRQRMFDKKALILACGKRTLRLRPVLDFTKEAADHLIEILKRCC
jgi:L-lysine 6-transaminase